jgi:exodeoxyribonuclease-3
VKGILIASIYLPNGNPQPGPKFQYKLAWFDRLIAHAHSLYELDAPVVLAGDFNVVPTDQDIYPSKSWSKDALLQPESRACFRRLLDQGWIDAVRTRHPDEPVLVLGLQARSLAARRGITHRLPVAEADAAAARVPDRRQVTTAASCGEEGASDHAPVLDVTLRQY